MRRSARMAASEWLPVLKAAKMLHSEGYSPEPWDVVDAGIFLRRKLGKSNAEALLDAIAEVFATGLEWEDEDLTEATATVLRAAAASTRRKAAS